MRIFILNFFFIRTRVNYFSFGNFLSFKIMNFVHRYKACIIRWSLFLITSRVLQIEKAKYHEEFSRNYKS